jgi:hypothetical protein
MVSIERNDWVERDLRRSRGRLCACTAAIEAIVLLWRNQRQIDVLEASSIA